MPEGGDVGSFVGGFLDSFADGITSAKQKAAAKEHEQLSGRLGLLKTLAGMPDIQSDPKQFGQVLHWMDETITGKSWDEKPKKAKSGGAGAQGQASPLQLLGHVLTPLSALAHPKGIEAMHARTLSPLDLGGAGVESNQSDPATGQKLPGAPGYGILGAMKTPEQREELERASQQRDQQAKIAQLDEAHKSKAINDEEYSSGRLQVMGLQPARTPAGAAGLISDEQVEHRRQLGVKIGLTGEALNEYALTAKLPTGYGKPATPVHQTSTDLAFDAFATKRNKKVDQLTATEKVQAVKEYREATKVSGEGNGSGTGKGSGNSIAERSKAAYVPNGPSIANPGGKDLAVEGMAWAYITTNHMPFTGMGGGKKGSENKREVAVARSGEILADLGISWAELPGLQANIKANAKALSTITSMGHTMSQFENTVTRNMDLAQQLSEKFSRTSSPFLNRIQGGIQRQSGDQAVDNFNLQMRTLAQEYAKVMAGSTSASGVRITDSEEATKLINGFIGDKNLSGLFEVMNKDMENRRAAVEREKAGIITDIRKPTQGFGKSADQPAADAGGGKPAAKKADYRWENGKLIKN